jgi:hypothetical protein
MAGAALPVAGRWPTSACLLSRSHVGPHDKLKRLAPLRHAHSVWRPSLVIGHIDDWNKVLDPVTVPRSARLVG